MIALPSLLMRCQAASVDNERVCLLDGFIYACNEGWVKPGALKRVDEPLKVRAHHDAALLMIPLGWMRFVDAARSDEYACVTLYGPDTVKISAEHLSEPIATVIASLKAHSLLHSEHPLSL